MIKFLILFSSLVFSVSQAWSQEEADFESELKKTMACHKSYAPTSDPFYEVFERQGMTFVGSTGMMPNSKKSALILSMTDGQDVFSITAPTPLTINPKTGQPETSFYDSINKFKLMIPARDGNKVFCVNYSPDMWVSDRVNQFDKSPPAKCDDFQTIEGEKQTGQGALLHVRAIQSRIHDRLRAQVYQANNYLNEPTKAGRPDLEAAQRMDGFSGQHCRELTFTGVNSSMTQVMTNLDKYRARSQSTASAPMIRPLPAKGAGRR
ncbi:MAG: hypothetical protein ACK5P7_06595 [Bdellovibrio sp.]